MLESHCHDFVCGPPRSQRLDCVREIGTVTKHIATFQGVVAKKLTKAPPGKAFLHFSFGGVGEETLETSDEGKVPLPGEGVAAAAIMLVIFVEGLASLRFVIEEAEYRDVRLQVDL